MTNKVYVVTIRSRQDTSFVPEELLWPKKKWAKNVMEAYNSIPSFESDGITASMTSRDKTPEDKILNIDAYRFFTVDLPEDDLLN